MSDSAVTITITPNGPYKVEGSVDLRDAEGTPIETREDRPFFLCRCGFSTNKPFCDGTHNREEWSPALADG